MNKNIGSRSFSKSKDYMFFQLSKQLVLIVGILLVGSMFGSIVKAQDKIGEFAVSAGGGAFYPMGQGEKLGLNFGVSGRYFPNDNFAMGIHVRMMRSSWAGNGYTLNFQRVPVMFSFEYFIGRSNFQPFIGGEAGFSINTFDTNPADAVTPVRLIELPYHVYNIAPKAGLVYWTTPHLGIMAEGTFNLFLTPYDLQGWKDDKGGVFIPATRGLNASLCLIYRFF
jgi:hypothetical protein